MAAVNLTAASGLQIMMPTRLQSGAAKVSCCCPDGRPAHRLMRIETTRISQHRPSATLHRSRRRQIRPLAAADEAITEETAEAAAEAEAPETEESGAEQQTPVEETPVEETSDASPFAELIQRARDAISSGSQEDQDQVLAEIDTELTVSSARADAADAQLSAIQGQVDAAQDKYLRLNAEFDNFRKRSAKEKSEAVNKAKGKVIEELLPVIDAFEAAAGQVKAETEGEQRIAGSYQGLYAKMVDAFKKMGLEVVPGVNSAFDPEVHEAIMRAPSEEVPDGTVLQEFRRGFKIGGQLLRPAMVQVSYSEEGTAAEADTLAAQAEHASTEPGDAGEQAPEQASSE